MYRNYLFIIISLQNRFISWHSPFNVNRERREVSYYCCGKKNCVVCLTIFEVKKPQKRKVLTLNRKESIRYLCHNFFLNFGICILETLIQGLPLLPWVPWDFNPEWCSGSPAQAPKEEFFSIKRPLFAVHTFSLKDSILFHFCIKVQVFSISIYFHQQLNIKQPAFQLVTMYSYNNMWTLKLNAKI